MERKSKILLSVALVTVAISLSATFYKTMILQDFEVGGLGVETEEDYTYLWFMYEGEEYEVEIESNNYDELLNEVSSTLETPVEMIDPDFVEELKISHTEAIESMEE